MAEVLLELRERVRPGITTGELDAFAEKAIGARGVESSFKGYDPHGLPAYPAVLCVSVNDEIVHGIPGPRELAARGHREPRLRRRERRLPRRLGGDGAGG